MSTNATPIEVNSHRRGHAFYPDEELPALYSTEEIPADEKLVHLHYRAPFGDWYVVEYDPDQQLAFGYVRLTSAPDCAEWGYISLKEIERLADGAVVERDQYFTPTLFGQLDLGE